VRRGQLWWADFDDIGRHAVLLLSRDVTYRIRSQATVALVTTRVRDIPVEVAVSQTEGLQRASVINLDNLATIDLSSLTEYAGTLSEGKLLQVEQALHFALGLSY
jgi:mRNA interferase MazF